MWVFADFTEDERAQLQDYLETNILGALSEIIVQWHQHDGQIALSDLLHPLHDFQNHPQYGPTLIRYYMADEPHVLLEEDETAPYVPLQLEHVDSLQFASQYILDEMAATGFLPPRGGIGGADKNGELIFTLPEGMPAYDALQMLWMPLIGAKETVSLLMHHTDYHFTASFFNRLLEFTQALRLCGIDTRLAEAFARDVFCDLLQNEKCTDMTIYKVLSVPGRLERPLSPDGSLDDARSAPMDMALFILKESELARLGDNHHRIQDDQYLLDQHQAMDEESLNQFVQHEGIRAARVHAYQAAALVGLLHQLEKPSHHWEQTMIRLLARQDNHVFNRE